MSSPNADDLTVRKMLNALEARGNCWTVSKCAQAANVSPHRLKKWIETDEWFAEKWKEATEAGADYLEDKYREIAVDTSNLGAIAKLLAVLRPEKWGPKAVEAQGGESSMDFGKAWLEATRKASSNEQYSRKDNKSSG